MCVNKFTPLVMLYQRLQLLTDFAEFLCDVAERQGTAYYYVICGGFTLSLLQTAANLATYDIQNRKLSIENDQWCKFIDTQN